ncbi:RNA methyltransferase, TrmH family [Nitrosospira sp. Nl5]|uniref:TrmH family RNA methyltransferase n=1 Tax=Nitrosospira sp. Nl5 TaxID=200120 RepID=UPI00088254F9|nr:RNA methyltransferase [Nitrosospira sp. Nl5]SCX86617.1 RNA methyltransferase, TrmH family [Nitrosospira sp. Nl5]
MKFITSRDNPFFRQLIKLEDSARQRKASGLTLLDGIHLVSAYQLALGAPRNLIMSESGCEDLEIKRFLAGLGAGADADVIVLSDALFREASPVKTPTGIMALISVPPAASIPVHKDERDDSFCVLLEAMQDPGNLGSILRSAAAAGATDIYLSGGCADAWSPKTLRSAMGAHFLLRIHEQSNLAEVARTFSGKVIATTLKAKTSLYQAWLTGPIAFVFGNEGVGLSDAVLQATSEQVSIPMQGGTESLNAAAAAAVCFFERVRQVKMSAGCVAEETRADSMPD